jgi:hypothetical protein
MFARALSAALAALTLAAGPAIAEGEAAPSSSSSEPSVEIAPSVPDGLGDADLELAVRAAYAAAVAVATAHGNYFARDGEFAPLRDAVAAALAKDFAAVVVPADPAENFDKARTCLAAPGTELRIAVNAFGDGVSLVAVTGARVFSYHYDPHEKAEIVVAPAADCVKPAS